MQLGFATTFNPNLVNNWSGTPYHMIDAFQTQGVSLQIFGDLQCKLPPFFKLKQLWKKYKYAERESPRFNLVAAKNYSVQLEKKIANLSLDAILAPQINPIALLNTQIPLFLWTDALYASLQETYPGFKHHSKSSIKQAHEITQACVSRCQLIFFSSEWAAKSAITHYDIAQNKIRVVPFGANVQVSHTASDIKAWLTYKLKKNFKLLFIGKHWDRKGGDIVFKVVSEINKTKLPVELHILGCHPPKNLKMPTNVYCHGFVSKGNVQGSNKINELLQESHLLFVPSRAEAYGIVFCEANAFGLPCLSTFVGGISTIIKNGINGQTFHYDAAIQSYTAYVTNLILNRDQYKTLALSAYNEYQKRLNWQVATNRVIKEIELHILKSK